MLQISDIDVGGYTNAQYYNSLTTLGQLFSKNVKKFDLLVLPNTIAKVSAFLFNDSECERLSLSNSCVKVEYVQNVKEMCTPSTMTEFTGWDDAYARIENITILSQEVIFSDNGFGEAIYVFTNCYFNGGVSSIKWEGYSQRVFTDPVSITNMYALDYTGEYKVERPSDSY